MLYYFAGIKRHVVFCGWVKFQQKLSPIDKNV